MSDGTIANPLRVAEYQQLMLSLSMSFINLPVDRIEQATHRALTKMASFFEADRAYVFSYDFEQNTGSNTQEWCAPGVEPMIEHLQSMPIEQGLTAWVDAHKQGKAFLVTDVDGLSSVTLRSVLQAQGIKSLLTAPLMNGLECIGFVGFDSVRRERLFTEGEYDLLALFANLLVSVVQRKNTIDALVQANKELELLATVFTHANEGITITDPEGIIIQVNNAQCRISGYSREELVGQNPRLLRSGRHSKDFYKGLWNQLVNTGEWHGEIWNRNKSGQLYAINLTVSRVDSPEGKLQHYVALATDITEQMHHQEQLERIALYDTVTHLPNRELLARQLKQAMAKANRQKSKIAIAYLDLDGFKIINDQYGHDIGDKLLASVAQSMSLSLRDTDTLARLGGDEFVAVFSGLDDEPSLQDALMRLLNSAAKPIEIEGRTLQVSASLGATLYPQSEPLDADQLLRQADQAMYQAKLSGKNKYMMFDTQSHRALVGQQVQITLIEKALLNGEFVLHYQPKVNMRTGAVIGVEALVRWQHPERGLLPPAEFLPVIENHPLSKALDEWVLSQALTQIAQWQTTCKQSLPISINLGAMTLQQGQFSNLLKHHLQQWPANVAQLLEIEILESSAIDDMNLVVGMIQTCRELGVAFSLDDFGVGYSSLTYLKRLPANKLKIDQSFVRDMLTDIDDLAILKGILSLAEVFGLSVIAEGVETIAHGDYLLDLGCECAQGYGIARPMPADRVIPWIQTWTTPASWLHR